MVGREARVVLGRWKTQDTGESKEGSENSLAFQLGGEQEAPPRNLPTAALTNCGLAGRPMTGVVGRIAHGSPG